ncbi:MAG: hypothetical protein EON98_15030 [Chitinophagaceae bacterium]|nr:MAG: hypothetical protein EON98_15030 [Chitinophagaceae bacterium]
MLAGLSVDLGLCTFKRTTAEDNSQKAAGQFISCCFVCFSFLFCCSLWLADNVLYGTRLPHFLFNCLNTLSYLVKNEPEKAYLFVHKLSNVFKYLLINKQKDFISLAEEVAFLEDYYFLLQVRFDDAIRITKTIEASQTDCVLPPCTLQALVENAIKNNFFSEKEPLVISIQVNNYFITVSNTVRPKQYRSTAGDAGLSKLKTRYRHLMNEDVLVQETDGHFLVKVPFLQKAQVA